MREIVKDPFILDFLAADPVRERDLSKALTDNLARFLRELGTGFAFVGAEVPVQCGDREFFLDLLFYHYRLHRFVVFELKLGRFEPEYVGKLNFYVQLVDDHLRDQSRDDPTLGMLLVVGRDDVTVEVALRGVTTPLAVTEWRRLPAKVRQALPTAEDLSATMTRTVREIESTAAALVQEELISQPNGTASQVASPAWVSGLCLNCRSLRKVTISSTPLPTSRGSKGWAPLGMGGREPPLVRSVACNLGHTAVRNQGADCNLYRSITVATGVAKQNASILTSHEPVQPDSLAIQPLPIDRCTLECVSSCGAEAADV